MRSTRKTTSFGVLLSAPLPPLFFFMYSSLSGWQGKYDDDAAADSTGVGDAGAVDRMLVGVSLLLPQTTAIIAPAIITKTNPPNLYPSSTLPLPDYCPYMYIVFI